MSKSYNNTIPLVDTEKKASKKGINKIKNESGLEPGERKTRNDFYRVFEIYPRPLQQT